MQHNFSSHCLRQQTDKCSAIKMAVESLKRSLRECKSIVIVVAASAGSIINMNLYLYGNSTHAAVRPILLIKQGHSEPRRFGSMAENASCDCYAVDTGKKSWACPNKRETTNGTMCTPTRTVHSSSASAQSGPCGRAAFECGTACRVHATRAKHSTRSEPPSCPTSQSGVPFPTAALRRAGGPCSF